MKYVPINMKTDSYRATGGVIDSSPIMLRGECGIQMPMVSVHDEREAIIPLGDEPCMVDPEYCGPTQEECKNKFNNLTNFGGFPTIPELDSEDMRQVAQCFYNVAGHRVR